MSAPCSNPKLALKLHAYELGMLSDSDRESVEVHLVECESCYREIKELDDAATLLRNDEATRKVAASLERDGASSIKGAVWFEKLAWALWPRRAHWRALPVAVALLLVSVVLFRVLPEGDQHGQDQQVLSLVPMRGGENNVLILDRGESAVIHFVYENFVQGRAYDIQILSDSGQIVFVLNQHSDFNDAGLGTIAISLNLFEEKTYKFVIIDPSLDPPQSVEEYYFEVKGSK